MVLSCHVIYPSTRRYILCLPFNSASAKVTWAEPISYHITTPALRMCPQSTLRIYTLACQGWFVCYVIIMHGVIMSLPSLVALRKWTCICDGDSKSPCTPVSSDTADHMSLLQTVWALETLLD